MSACFPKLFCGTMMVAMIALPIRSEDRPQRGQPILFSEVKTEGISTNYGLGGSKASFKDMDDSLKKPFEFFSGDNRVRPIRPPVTQPMIQRTKKSQELFQNKEDSFFGESENDEMGTDDNTDRFDPWAKKYKTPLDRYYNRLDRERGVTNRSKGDSFRGIMRDEEDYEFGASGDLFGRFFNDNSSGPARLDGPSQGASRMTNIFSGGGLFSTEPVKPRTFDDMYGFERNLVAEKRQVETRHDAFRQLLGMTPVSKVQSTSPFDNSYPYSATKPTEPYTPRSSYGVQPPNTPRSSLSAYPGYSTTPSQNTTAQGFVPIPGLTPTPTPRTQQPKSKVAEKWGESRWRDF